MFRRRLPKSSVEDDEEDHFPVKLFYKKIDFLS